MIRTTLIAGACLWALAAAATAEPAPSAPPPATSQTPSQSSNQTFGAPIMVIPVEAAAPAEAPKPTNRKAVCYTQETIGTRLGAKRVCVYKEDADDRQYQARQALDAAQAAKSFSGP
jgi:hypothetical protein